MTTPSDPLSPGSEHETPASEAPPSEVARQPLRGFVRFLWPLLCLFQTTMLITGGVLWWRSRPADKGPTEPVVAEPTRVLPRAEQTPAEPLPEILPAPIPTVPSVELAAGDDSLRELAFERALAIYRPLAESAPSPLREAVCYRIGLCLEGLGRLEAALAEYRRIGPSTFAPRAAAAGQLGQARVYVRLRKPEEAKSLLYDLVLRSNQTGLREQPFLGDVAYLLGLASILQTTRPPRPGPLHDSVISHTGTDWPVERALGFLAGREEPAVEQTGGAYVLVERAGSTPEAFAVRASVRAMPVVECLERLAEQSGLGLDLSVQARRKLEGRVLLADVYSLPLAEVLRAVSEPLGLLTRCREVQLLVRAEEELSPEALETLRRGAARQTLQAAFLAYPNDPLRSTRDPAPYPFRPAAYLEAANLEAVAGHLDEALGMYQRLVSEHPFSPVAVEGFYNLGLTHLRRGRLREARAAFYQVIDRAPGHEMTALAYLRIGRSHLEADEPAEALPPLRRALGIAAGSSTEPAAAVTLAATWLLTGKAAEAGSLIYDTRHLFGDDPYARCASFLAALARFRLAKEPNRAQREASDLLATLLLLDDPSAVRPVGELLMGQAYQELGLGERMALVYERALPGSRGPLAARLAYTLGDYYFAREEYTPATRRLTPLAPSAYDPWASLAQQRLAEIALARHKPQECLDWCWQLLREGRQSDQADTLRVMGRAFDRLGEYRQAARCYGGEWPLP